MVQASPPKDGAGGADLHDEALGALDRFEVMVAVEAVRMVIECVDGDQAASGLGRCGDDPLERVEQQLAAEPLTVERLVEREPADQVPRNDGVTRAQRAAGEIGTHEPRRSDRVERDDDWIVRRCPDRRARDARTLAAHCLVAQPQVESVASRVKPR